MTTGSAAGTRGDGFDTAAAVTRSLLGWGVLAGPFYLVVGLVLACTRPGFDLKTHRPLMLGDAGTGRDRAGTARYSRISGVIVLVGFVGGAALSALPIGVASLWVAVVAGWAWLTVATLRLYRPVPHPDAHRRVQSA